MSTALGDFRAAVKGTLVGRAAELTEASIIIQRGPNILTQIEEAAALDGGGVVVTIAARRGRNPDPDGPLILDTSLVISLWILTDYFPADPEVEERLFEAIACALHGKRLHLPHCYYELAVTDWAEESGKHYWVRALKIRQRLVYPDSHP